MVEHKTTILIILSLLCISSGYIVIEYKPESIPIANNKNVEDIQDENNSVDPTIVYSPTNIGNQLRYFQFEDSATDYICNDALGVQNGIYSQQLSSYKYQFEQASFSLDYNFAVHFNSTDQAGLIFEDHADWNFGSNGNDQPFSMSIWSYQHTDGEDLEIDAGAEYELMLNYYPELLGGNHVQFYFQGSWSNNEIIGVRANITNREFYQNWKFITCTYDGSKTKEGLTIYIDGINRTSNRFAEGNPYVGFTPFHATKYFYLYNHTVDEFILWEKELTAFQVLKLFENYMEIKK